MGKAKMNSGRAMTIPVAMVIGWGIGVILSLVLASALTQMVLAETVGENVVGPGAWAILGLSAGVDALVSAALAKKRWLQVCVGAGGLFLLSWLTIAVTMFGGDFAGVGWGALTTIGCSSLVGLMALRGEKNQARKRKFRSYG